MGGRAGAEHPPGLGGRAHLPLRGRRWLAQLHRGAWIYRTESHPNTYESIISRQIGDADTEIFNLCVVKDHLRAYALPNSLGGVGNATSPNPAALGRWQHTAATFDGQRVRLYEDGVVAASIGIASTVPPTPAPIYIGTNVNGGPSIPQNFSGTIDEVLLYDVALPPSAIVALARGAAPPVASP